MNQSYAAHEILESMEAMRTKAAEIEQHGFFAAECQDPQLKQLLLNHQQRMIQVYQQGIGLLQGKGATMNHQPPMLRGTDHSVGVQHAQMSTIPNPNPTKLSDNTISTLALNMHKAGAMMGMIWANECTDANIRNYHVQGANLCQEMAYDMFQYMNQRGYYQPPAFEDQQQLNSLINTFQPIGNQGQMSGQPTQQMLHNSHYGMQNQSTNTGMDTRGTTGYYQ